jgi:Zn finger protein HypA/HybF involved in hydrogenase expression
LTEEASETPPGDGVATAREKFHCPSCGGEANWSPAKQALVCPFCGAESPIALQARTAETVIVEHDLLEALRQTPDEARGWAAAKTTVRCQSCQAISVFDADKVGSRCEFCGSAQLVPYAEVNDAFRPESLLPLKLSEAQARDAIRAWYKRQWLAPNALNARALTDTVRAIYLPYWTFDAKASAQWTADAGTYYYTGSGKNRERHVRWTPASGELSHVFDDDLVPASTGVAAQWLHGVEPFPTDGLIPYDPGYLAGWTVERYQIDLPAAATRSRAQMDETLRQLCSQQVPGDTSRNLVVQAAFSDRRFKHILVPVWLMTYIYGAKSYQVVVNGVTGKMAGGRPWSWVKILLLVIAALIVLALYASNS